MLSLLLPLLFLPVLGSAQNSTADGEQDWCATIAAATAAKTPDRRPSTAWKCLASTPFLSELRDNVLEVVGKSYDLDIYEFNALNTPPPLTQKADVRAELKRMSTQAYTSDFEFNYDLYNTFNHLNDGHRGWVNCYLGIFQTLQTLPLVSLARTGGTTTNSSTALFIAPDADRLTAALGLTQLYNTDYEIDAAALAGKEVTKIDGKDPWEYIDDVANTETGTYQDLNVRRNAALAGYASNGESTGTQWVRNLGSLAQTTFPIRDNITYTVVMGDGTTKDVLVPYISIPRIPLTTANDFFTSLCLLPNLTTSTTSSSRRDAVVEPRQSTKKTCKPPPTTSPFTIEKTPVNTTAYLGGRWNQFFVLPGTEQGKVGVVYITVFDPDGADPTSSCVDEFVQEIGEGLKNFTKAGVERVIIDTTDDGGGLVILSYLWQRIFAGAANSHRIGFDSVYRDAPLNNAIGEAGTKAGTLKDDGYYGAGSLTDADGKSFPADFDIYKQTGVSLDINGQKLPLSTVVRDSLALVNQNLPDVVNDPSKPAYAFDNLLIFSNGGTCGSACSLLTTFLNIELNISTHLSNARPDQPLEYSSFAAQVFNTDLLYPELAKFGLISDPNAPPALKVMGKFSMPIRGFYYPNTTDFVQYRSIPAQKTFSLTADEYLDPLKMYAKAAQSKWGGSAPVSNENPAAAFGSASPSSTEEKGVLGMSKTTTIKVAVGVGAAVLFAGAAALLSVYLRRRSRAQAGRYVQVEKSTAPLGEFEFENRQQHSYGTPL